MAAPARLIILAGAPAASSLRWDEANLLSTLLPCFSANPTASAPRLPATGPLWRSIPLQRQHLPTGLTPRSDPPADRPHRSFDTELSFLDLDRALSATASSAEADELKSQFYDRSYAAHAAVPAPAPQPSPAASSPDASPASSARESTSPETTRHAPPRPPTPPLTPLAALPPASHLAAITPQTVSVNLVATVLRTAAPRRVRPRRGPDLHLHELTVADTTRAGFAISLWVPVPTTTATARAREPDPASLAAVAPTLRPRDIVLVRNVALGAWRGEVYGQSVGRGVTRLEVLYREGGGPGGRPRAAVERAAAATGGTGGLAARVAALREWGMRFVAGGPDGRAGRGGDVEEPGGGTEVLPEDTQ
jgi:hypothetical protein